MFAEAEPEKGEKPEEASEDGNRRKLHKIKPEKPSVNH